MNTTICESLFQEHRQRFFDQFQQENCITEAVENALFVDDQMGWSLGIIPWRAWRYPFQKAMMHYLIERYPKTAKHLYYIVNTALATAHGDYFSLPSESDRDALLITIDAFCSDEVSARIGKQVREMRPEPPFLRSFYLEKLFRSLSKKRCAQKAQEHIQYFSYFLHFRIIDTFLKRYIKLLKSAEDIQMRDSIALLTFHILQTVFLEAPDFSKEKRLMADTSKMSPEIYNFWSWQYTYRNKEFQTLREPLDIFLRQSGMIFANLPISNHKEYQIVYKRIAGEHNVIGMMFPEYDLAISKISEKFDCHPAWPITDYTSDFILKRMLSGEFKYWERNTPPPKISKEGEFHLCLRNVLVCTNENRITQIRTNGLKTWEECAPECIISMKNQEQDIYHDVLNAERPRIRTEGLHRMIGLWLWDYCYEHRVKVAEAIRALKEQHFPENNPDWDVCKIPEIKNIAENADWYIYREKTTESSTLHADYQDACRCIEVAKFLPLSRGTKKASKASNTKRKIKK